MKLKGQKQVLNPYDPQTPAKPEYFGGRQQILKSVRERIDIAKTYRKSGGILIYGHRGVGKTSLLKKIIDEAGGFEDNPANALIIYRRLGRTTTEEELYGMVTEEAVTGVQRRKSFIERMAAKSKNVSGIRLFEIGIDFSRDAPNISNYQKWKLILQNLRNVDYVLIALDDTDYLSTEAIGELKTIAEDVQNVPVLLVVSGGVEFEEKLVGNYSPVARIFSGASFNITQFSLEETREVLTKPLTGENTKWKESAILELQKFTAGFPYLVQCLAKASYIESGTIDENKVRDSVNLAVEIGRSWLAHVIPTASDRDVVSFMKIADLKRDIIQSVEMSDLGISAPYIGR
ncbi:MAG TPA: ATP-binding protein, partial [Nitrososphaera sp.]|nr:ATP-binding protein [Nitrososphaera sp.]